MGQRGTAFATPPTSPEIRVDLAIFPTELGWIGLLGCQGRLVRLTIGHASSDKVRHEIYKASGDVLAEDSGEDALLQGVFPEECDWAPELRKRLVRYCAGTPEDFSDVELQLPPQTPFQRCVLDRTRKIGYGFVLSYGLCFQIRCTSS